MSTHELEHLNVGTSPHCLYESAEPPGDGRQDLTGPSQLPRLPVAKSPKSGQRPSFSEL